MRKLNGFLLPSVVAMLLLLLAACGGDKGKDSGSAGYNAGDNTGDDSGGTDSSQSGGELGELFVKNPGQALTKSAENFSEEVQSVEGDFKMSFTATGLSVDVGGDFAFRAPDAMYMTMALGMEGDDPLLSALGNIDFDVLLQGENLYMKTPLFGGEWVVMSMADLGVDAEQYQELLEQQSPFDYGALVSELDEVESLGEEEIEGQTYTHLRVQSEFAELMSAFADSFESGGFDTSSVPLGQVSGPIVFDMWVSPDSGLPYRILASGQMDLPAEADPNGTLAGPISFELKFDFENYNGDVSIPEAPKNAQSFVEMFGEQAEGLFGEGD